MYGKLFESTFGGSMYGKGAAIFAVWCYAIAHTRPDSLVELNPQKVANDIGCQKKEVEKAIAFLCSPDPKSTTKDEAGKRLIREGEYLYKTVNYAKYNSVRNEPERREYNRIKQRESRARKAAGQNKSTADIKQGQTTSSSSAHVSVPVPVPVEKESEGAHAPPTDLNGQSRQTKTERACRLPSDFTLTDDRREVAVAEQLDPGRTFAKFCDYWRSVPGAKARKLDWDATWRNWCRTDADRGGRTIANRQRAKTTEELEAEERNRGFQ